MQKIEKWRLQHLSHVLLKISDLLTEGGNGEWGNVFKHFHHEAQHLATAGDLKLDGLHRFISNVKNCFSGSSSLKNLTLSHKNAEKTEFLNRDYFKEKAMLQRILNEIEEISHEYKH